MAFATHLSTETQAKVTSGLLLNKSIRLFLVFILFAQWCAVKWKSLSHVWLFATPWTPACQGPLSMGFYRPEYWSGCRSLLQGILPTQGLNLGLLAGKMLWFAVFFFPVVEILLTAIDSGHQHDSGGGRSGGRSCAWHRIPASQMQSRPTGQRCKKKKSGSDALGMVDCLLLFSITCFIAGAYSVTFNNGRG